MDLNEIMENLIKSIIEDHLEFADEIEPLVPFPPLPDQYLVFLKYMGRSMIDVSPSFMEFIFSEDFRRDLAKYLYSRKWME